MVKKLILISILISSLISVTLFAQDIDLIEKAVQAEWGTTAGDTLAS